MTRLFTPASDTVPPNLSVVDSGKDQATGALILATPNLDDETILGFMAEERNESAPLIDHLCALIANKLLSLSDIKKRRALVFPTASIMQRHLKSGTSKTDELLQNSSEQNLKGTLAGSYFLLQTGIPPLTKMTVALELGDVATHESAGWNTRGDTFKSYSTQLARLGYQQASQLAKQHPNHPSAKPLSYLLPTVEERLPEIIRVLSTFTKKDQNNIKVLN